MLLSRSRPPKSGNKKSVTKNHFFACHPIRFAVDSNCLETNSRFLKAAAAPTAVFAFLGSRVAPPFLVRIDSGKYARNGLRSPTIPIHEQNENCQIDRHSPIQMDCLEKR